MNGLSQSLNSGFFQRALIEATLVGALGGAVGVHVLLRRLSFYVAALSHATLPGIAVASAAGLSVFIGGWICGILVAVAVTIAGRAKGMSDASAIGVVLTGAFAVGILLVSAGVGADDQDFTAFLVGSILTVDSNDLRLTLVVTVLLLSVAFAFHKELVATAFDPAGAQARGFRLNLFDFAMLLAITVVVVTVIPAVGTLLAVALLTVPALVARHWCGSVGASAIAAAAVGAFGSIMGLLVSAVWTVAAGGSIALSLTLLFVVSAVVRSATRRTQKRGA